jgi:hypothetical protein
MPSLRISDSENEVAIFINREQEINGDQFPVGSTEQPTFFTNR